MTNARMLCAWRVTGWLCCFASLAHAETESFTATIPTTTIPESGYFGSVQIDRFDPAGGRVLESVELELLGDFTGTTGFENTDPDQATTFRLELAWFMELERPDASSLVGLTDSRRVQGLVDPFDGVLDFGGFSGATFDVASTGVASSASTTASDDLALFTGAAPIDLPVVAAFETSAWAGSMSFETMFRDVTFGGELTITYTYVPEPLTAGLFLLAGLALRRIR